MLEGSRVSGQSVVQYKKQDQDEDALRKLLRELANKRRRLGYRRFGILLAKEGFAVNHKKLFRLFCEEGLSVRRQRWRKRALGTHRPILVPGRANQRWSLDFVSDAFADSQRFRVSCILNDCTREALVTVVDRSLSGAHMTRELDELIRRRGQPDMIVFDNGTEMTSHAVLRWCQYTGVGWHYIAPGKPMENGVRCQIEPVPPIADGFVAFIYAAFMQQVFDIPKRKWETDV